MKELLTYILQRALPEGTDFEVSQRENEHELTLELTVPEEYRGKVIGRGGSNIKAIRDLLNVLAYEQGKRVYLKVLD